MQTKASGKTQTSPGVTIREEVQTPAGYWDKNGYPVGRLRVNYQRAVQSGSTALSFDAWKNQKV